MSAQRALLFILATVCGTTATARHRPVIKMLSFPDEQQPSPDTHPPRTPDVPAVPSVDEPVCAWKHLPRHVVIPGEDDKKEQVKTAPPQPALAPKEPAKKPSPAPEMPVFTPPSPEEMEDIFASLRDVFSMAEFDDDGEDGDNMVALFE